MKKSVLCLGLVACLLLAIPGPAKAFDFEEPRVKELNYILGQADACGVDVTYESQYVSTWMFRRLSGRDMAEGLDTAREARQQGKIDQKGGKTGIGCSYIKKKVRNTDWP